MKTSTAAVCLCSVILLAGCGENMSSGSQKAVDQIRLEAEKLVTQKIETLRSEALGQLKKLGDEKTDEKASPAKPDEPSGQETAKATDDGTASASR